MNMKRLPLGPLYYEFSRHNEPRLRIEPGVPDQARPLGRERLLHRDRHEHPQRLVLGELDEQSVVSLLRFKGCEGGFRRVLRLLRPWVEKRLRGAKLDFL